MTITPDELSEKGYVLLDKLEHNELGPFVQLYIKNRTKYAVFYILCKAQCLATVALARSSCTTTMRNLTMPPEDSVVC